MSKTSLPEGDGYNLVVQFKKTAGAKPEKLPLQARDAHLRWLQTRGVCVHLRRVNGLFWFALAKAWLAHVEE